MIKHVIHILLALRFYVAVAVAAWFFLPAPHVRSEFHIVRFTITALHLMTAHTERILQDYASETSGHRNVATTFTALPDGGTARPLSQ